MKKIDSKLFICLLINIFITVSTTVITIYGVINGAGSGQVGEQMIGLGFFKAFTMDSNILLGICSAFLSFEQIMILLKRKEKINSKIITFYLTGVNSVCVTFLTVLFFLAPVSYIGIGIKGFISSYSGMLFYFHFFNPVLSVISLFLIKTDYKLNLTDIIISCIPLIIYSVVYCVNVVILKNWSDFYGFTFGGKNYLIPIVLIIMYALSFAIGFVLVKLKNKKS